MRNLFLFNIFETLSNIEVFNEANVAAVGKSWATSSEKQGPDKILKDTGFVKSLIIWDKNKDDDISIPFEAIIMSALIL